MSSIQFTDSVASEVVRPPARVSEDQVASVLQMMEGRWKLDFSRGTERLKIMQKVSIFVNYCAEPAFLLKWYSLGTRNRVPRKSARTELMDGASKSNT